VPFSSYYETCLIRGIQAIEGWEKQWAPFDTDPTLNVNKDDLWPLLKTFTERLKDNYPFFHPRYAGQMLKPPHSLAVLGYFMTMLINPNNHALDGGPATAQMEKDCIQAFAKCFGYENPLGHLTSSGTIANLEALWIAREIHPEKAVAYSEQAHYTHGRMAQLIQVKTVKIPATPEGRMDLDALETALKEGHIGTVVVTLGTTSLGALDPLDAILALRQTYDFRIHVDAAYAGFYRVLAETDPAFSLFKRIAECDSLVFDPHKHGLQPYGCGCIMFKDPAVGAYYRHDSPYTYFTSDDLHLGEISLECSRPGAAAAALWLTLQCFPLTAEAGFGPILQKTRAAALYLAGQLQAEGNYRLYLPPELDIVIYFPQGASTREISERTDAVFQAAMAKESPQPLYLAKLRVDAAQFHRLHPEIEINTEDVTLLRSCMMKPEHLTWASEITASLNLHARETIQV
jgi:glutamate/tyrosine decarboxylase-like PLP-dependent enzyme